MVFPRRVPLSRSVSSLVVVVVFFLDRNRVEEKEDVMGEEARGRDWEKFFLKLECGFNA